MPFPFQKLRTIFIFVTWQKGFRIWLIKLWYSQERRRTFYASTKLGQTNFEQLFSFSFSLRYTQLQIQTFRVLHVLRKVGERYHVYIEYGCKNVRRIFTFVSRTIPNTDSQSWASHPGSRPLGEEREGCGLEIGGHTEQCRNYGLS